jgi:uncharacterized protein (TIGR00369 family)
VFTNAHGDIFGGWLLSQMDLAGSAVAVRRANGRVVTVAVTAMSFQRPVFVGDEVSCYAKILKVGRTSITVKVEVFARRGRSGEQIQVTEGSSPMWRWIQNQSRGRCELLSAPASDRHSLLVYVGDVWPQLFGDDEHGGSRGLASSGRPLGESAFGTKQTCSMR